MDYGPPGSPVHSILHASILEWVAMPFSRESCPPRDRTEVSCTAGRFFTVWATRESPNHSKLTYKWIHCTRNDWKIKWILNIWFKLDFKNTCIRWCGSHESNSVWKLPWNFITCRVKWGRMLAICAAAFPGFSSCQPTHLHIRLLVVTALLLGQRTAQGGWCACWGFGERVKREER